MEESFIYYIESSIKENWDRPALTDYHGINCNYKDVARKIEKLHILFEHAGIKKGDKIALCGRNSTNWGIAFLATLTYGAVAVPILNEFKPDTIHHIINHSGARVLFVGKSVWDNIDHESMPTLDGIIAMADYSVISSRNTVLAEIAPQLETLFKAKYPEVVKKHIIGVQGNIWNEYMQSDERRDYQAFPRAVALAETGWTQNNRKNWP